MQCHVTPFFVGEPNCVWIDNIFSESELNYLQNITKLANQPALIKANNGTVDTTVRRTDVEWLDYTDKDSWVFHKLTDTISKLNAHHYRFDITGISEPCQLTNYNSDVLGMYDWHVDRGFGVNRKLSAVLQLSHPSDYEGGELHIQTNPQHGVTPKARGTLIVFPSFTLHRVTPVTKGTRQSLVTWFTGPVFR